MNVLNFIAKNWDSVAVIVIFIIFVLGAVKRGETKVLKTVLFGLVTQAEKQFGSGTGALKFATVADWIWQRIPLILRMLFTKKDIEKMIEQTLEMAKSAWKQNDNLKEYIEAEAEIKVAEIKVKEDTEPETENQQE